MLRHVSLHPGYQQGKHTGFWTASAVYCATSWLIIFLGTPFAAAASAINCERHALSKLKNRNAASSTVWPTVSRLKDSQLLLKRGALQEDSHTHGSAEYRRYSSRLEPLQSAHPLPGLVQSHHDHHIRSAFRRSYRRLPEESAFSNHNLSWYIYNTNPE